VNFRDVPTILEGMLIRTIVKKSPVDTNIICDPILENHPFGHNRQFSVL